VGAQVQGVNPGRCGRWSAQQTWWIPGLVVFVWPEKLHKQEVLLGAQVQGVNPG